MKTDRYLENVMALEMPEIPKEFWRDLRWGREHYAELQRQYRDVWVAIADKKVVSYGKDGAKVREEAQRITGRKEVYMTFIESGVAVYFDFSESRAYIELR